MNPFLENKKTNQQSESKPSSNFYLNQSISVIQNAEMIIKSALNRIQILYGVRGYSCNLEQHAGNIMEMITPEAILKEKQIQEELKYLNQKKETEVRRRRKREVKELDKNLESLVLIWLAEQRKTRKSMHIAVFISEIKEFGPKLKYIITVNWCKKFFQRNPNAGKIINEYIDFYPEKQASPQWKSKNYDLTK